MLTNTARGTAKEVGEITSKSEITYDCANSFEEFSKRVGFVSSIEDWAKKHRLNVYVAVEEHKEIKQQIITEIKLHKSLLVLDLGCGYGFLMTRLNQVCPQVTVIGADISRFQVENAKLRSVRGFLVVCCAEYLPFRDEVFDCAVCSEVIEHVTDPRASLAEMERTLTNTGYWCISTDNPVSIYRKLVALFARITRRKKSIKEEFLSLNVLTGFLPNALKAYKIHFICPYPLLPMVGPLGSGMIGKAWISMARLIARIPHFDKPFLNKYVIFGVKRRI